MPTRIELRGDTAANWTTANPVLAAREPAIETDTGKLKFGDGLTAWATLAYAGFVLPLGGLPESALAAAVQAKLDAASTAVQPAALTAALAALPPSGYQKPVGGIPESDMAAAAQAKLDAGGTAVQPAGLTTALANQHAADTSAFDASGAAAAAVTGHVAAADPHGDRAYAVAQIATQHTADLALLAAKADLVGGLVPTSQLPKIAIDQGAITVANAAARYALVIGTSVEPGQPVIQSSTGQTFILAAGATDPSQTASWLEIVAAGKVQSVNGQTGVIVLAASDVGADAAGAATSAVSSHVAAADPHGDRAYALAQVTSQHTADVALFAPIASPHFTGSPLGPDGSAVATATSVAAAVSGEASARSSGDAAALQKSSNLSDLASPATARTNLGLGTAATAASSAFDAAGVAAAAAALLIPYMTDSSVKTGAYTASVAAERIHLSTAGSSTGFSVTLPQPSSTAWEIRSTVLDAVFDPTYVTVVPIQVYAVPVGGGTAVALTTTGLVEKDREVWWAHAPGAAWERIGPNTSLSQIAPYLIGQNLVAAPPTSPDTAYLGTTTASTTYAPISTDTTNGYLNTNTFTTAMSNVLGYKKEPAGGWAGTTRPATPPFFLLDCTTFSDVPTWQVAGDVIVSQSGS